MTARRGTGDYLKKPLSIDALTDLQARIVAGQATNEEREWVRRSLIRYRSRYRGGNLSPVTARRLGLIDGEGKELDCKIEKS
jgi:hypothetical protein